MRKKSILLADDHQLFRQGIRSLLEPQPDLVVVGEAGDGLTAVRLAESLKPDLLVTDLLMPTLSGLEVVNQVHRRSPATRCIIVSMYRDEAYVLEALRNGASAFVLKESPLHELLQAIRDVVAGRKYLSAPFSDHAIDAYLQKARHAELDPYDRLTIREREVLQLKAEGHSIAVIAQKLFISPRTVEIHRGNLMRKLGLKSQTDTIRYALRRGLLAPEMGPPPLSG